MFLRLEAILGKVLGTGCPVPALWTVLPCPGDRRGQTSSIPVSAKMALVTVLALPRAGPTIGPVDWTLNTECFSVLLACAAGLSAPDHTWIDEKNPFFFPLALAWGLQWRPQRRSQTNLSGKAAKEAEGRPRKLKEDTDVDVSSRWRLSVAPWPAHSHLEKRPLQSNLFQRPVISLKKHLTISFRKSESVRSEGVGHLWKGKALISKMDFSPEAGAMSSRAYQK